MADTWKPPTGKATPVASSWRPPVNGVVSTDSVDNRRWDQKAADFMEPVANVFGKAQQAAGVIQDVLHPEGFLANQALNAMNQSASDVGDQATEFAGSKGVPGLGAAALGMGTSVAVNPMSYLNPATAGIAGKFLKPVVPASRVADVAVAQKYGMPLTRADMTGSKSASLVESTLARSLTGSGPLQKLAQLKQSALESARSAIQGKYGTSEPLSASGIESKMGTEATLGNQYKNVQQMYKDIPDVSMRTPNLEKALNDVDFNVVDKGAHATIQDLRSRIVGEPAATTETFPQSFGSKTRTQEVQTPETMLPGPREGEWIHTPAGSKQVTSDLQSEYRVRPAPKDLPVVAPGSKTGDPHAIFAYNDVPLEGGGAPISKYQIFGDPEHPVLKQKGHGTQLTLPEIKQLNIPVVGRTPRSVGKWEPLDLTDESPAARTQSFQQLNDMRNRLSKEIQSDTQYNPFGNQVGPRAQSLVPFKKALDTDIQEYVKSNQSTPYGKMESNEFNERFSKANTGYGEYKKLRNDKLVQKLSRVRESDIPQTVFGPGRIEDVKIAKRAMGEKGFNAAKKQFFNDLLESKNITTQLGKYEPEFLSGVFSGEELNALKEAASLKKTMNTAESLGGNPSGTAQVAQAATTAGLIGAAATKALLHPSLAGFAAAGAETAAVLGIPYAGTKAYLGTTHGIPYSVGKGTLNAASKAAVADNTISADRRKSFMSEYVKRIVGGK